MLWEASVLDPNEVLCSRSLGSNAARSTRSRVSDSTASASPSARRSSPLPLEERR